MRTAILIAGLLLAAAPLAADQASLRDAVRSGDAEAVKALLNAGADPNERDTLGATPLHDAAWFGNEQIVRVLVEGGARVDTAHEEGGSTPLDYAVLRGNATIVRLLLEHGAKSARALFTAAGHGQTEIVRLLIGAGFSVTARDDSGSAPLDLAALQGGGETVRLLLAEGAGRDQPHPGTGAAPLIEAASRGNAGAVAALLEAGADPRVRDRGGWTALRNAVANGRVEAAEQLLEKTKPPASDLPALLRAAAERGDGKMTALLAAHGADPAREALLAMAARNGHLALAETLLGLHVPVDGRDSSGATPLYNAALNGWTAVAALLLRHGASVNSRETESGDTPLYAAASLGHTETALLLLGHGADPNLPNKSGHRAVYAAAANGFPDLAAEIGRRGGR